MKKIFWAVIIVLALAIILFLLYLFSLKEIKIYFSNTKLDPEISCIKVFPVARKILRINSEEKLALEELLKGPTEAEKKEEFFTTLNAGVRIQKFEIKNGIAFVDFNKKLDEGVAGSCRVSAIRAEIEETLKQFPTIKNVVISIDGSTEEILQP